jgi:hypothetical protein
MNKIKFLYDVVKTMKTKEILNGVLKAEVEKDQVKIFSIQNEFEKNLSTGQIKSKVNAEVDYEGRTGAQEYCDGFGINKEQPDFQRHIPHFHGRGREGLKEKFAKWAFALGILDAVKIEEQQDKTMVISLNVNDIPTDMKLLFHEKMSQAKGHHHFDHPLMHEVCAVDELDLVLNLHINKNYEVENILLTAGGNQSDRQSQQHDLKARAELCFLW